MQFCSKIICFLWQTLQNACNAAKCFVLSLLANSWDVDVTAIICQIPEELRQKNNHKWQVLTSHDKEMQESENDSTVDLISHFLIVFAVERGLLGSLTTEHKEPSLYSQTTKAGPAQQSSDFFQLPMTSKNRKCWTKMDKGIRLNKHTKKERTQNPSHQVIQILKICEICATLRLSSIRISFCHFGSPSWHFPALPQSRLDVPV